MPPFISIPSIPSAADIFSISPIRNLLTIQGGGGPTDSNWQFVSLMMGFDNVSGPNPEVFIDESQYNHTPITAAGQEVNWFNDPVDPVFVGTGSGRFIGGGGRPTVTASLPVPLRMGTDDFTVELFAYPATQPAFSNPVGNLHTDKGSWGVSYASGKWSFFSTNVVSLSSTTTSPLSTWTWVAVSRNGETIRLFVNGIMVDKNTTVGLSSFTGVNLNAMIVGAGSYFGSGQWYEGKIDELRISKGVGRYNSDSSFPTPSARFPRASA